MKKYHPKMFLPAIFFITGITLFSCTNKDGNQKQKEEIEVANSEKNQNNKSKQNPLPSHSSKRDNGKHSEKTIKINRDKVGTKKTASDKNNSNYSSIPANKDQATSIKSEENNKEKSKNNTTSKKETVTKTTVPLNKNAELPGGIDQFYTFFEKEYKRPENTWKLNIKISFAVEKNGSVTYLASEPAVDKIVETEIMRVLSLSPKWQPGEANGKKVKMQYSLPILLK